MRLESEVAVAAGEHSVRQRQRSMCGAEAKKQRRVLLVRIM